MPGRLEFDFTFNEPQEGPSARHRTNGAMRILLMGDFSGRSNRGLMYLVINWPTVPSSLWISIILMRRWPA